MYALQNRGVALLLCLCMILVSSLFGTATSLGALREQSELVFVSSGMQQDLIDLSAQCANIITVAGRHLSADDADLQEAAAYRETLADAITKGSAKQKHDAAMGLLTSTGILIGRLPESGASPSEQDLAAGAWAAANSKQALLASGPFNQQAAYYNFLLGKFPASILGRLTGLRPLELFA